MEGVGLGVYEWFVPDCFDTWDPSTIQVPAALMRDLIDRMISPRPTPHD